MTDMDAKKAERLAQFARVDLYPVTCRQLSAGRTDLEILDGIIAGGARIVQLRDKDTDKRALYEKAVIFRERTVANGVLLIINDHVDIAIAVDADGVHLGQDDLPLHAARKLIPDKIIGISSHDLPEAIEAQKGGADYVNIGPIFATKTKEGVPAFLGSQAIREISPHLTVPFTTMGGINLTNIGQVVAAGASKVAVVTAVTKADDVAAAVMQLRKAISGQNS